MNRQSGWILGAVLLALVLWGGETIRRKVSRREFIKRLLPQSREIEKEFKIPAIIALTQAAHESNFGNSKLAQNDRNLFGIIATDAWIKAGLPYTVYATTEFIKGAAQALRRPFRRYDSELSSLKDWAAKIQRTYPRAYQAALNNNPDRFFDELQRGNIHGEPYATDPRYAAKLKALRREVEALV